MATLLLGAVGTALGGPLGGAIGALIGRQVDGVVFGAPRVKGPRLKDLDVTTSTYGSAIPRHFGRMRASGTVIWATDLVERSDTSGGGKGSPSVTRYSYSVSCAIGLCSRPILDVGRIWADGKLLRGADGTLKVGGELRIHRGTGDQPADPLLLSAEGVDRCPAYRNLAYVVFEDLDLAEYYNRIPALTFEIVADDTVTLEDVLEGAIDASGADVTLPAFEGLTGEGSVADLLAALAPVSPVDVDAAGDALIFRAIETTHEAVALPEAAVAVADDAFGGNAGFVRRRLAVSSDDRPSALRYYDTGRDFLPGVQRAATQSGPGQPLVLELPAAMSATAARALIERVGSRLDWSRDRITWRTAELRPDLGPGRLVVLPGIDGHWRVEEWEWRETGIELSLSRAVPRAGLVANQGAVDPGRAIPQVDLPPAPTSVHAFERPWDGVGDGGLARIFAAVSSPGVNWTGASLYAEDAAGALAPLGPSGRRRSVIGTLASSLAAADPQFADRSNWFDVDLSASDLLLAPASAMQIASGANLALVGDELVQFARPTRIGERRWRIEGLLRGRGGTEHAVEGHVTGEPFVLVDDKPRMLDGEVLRTHGAVAVVALGLGDADPVGSPIALRGIGTRPLSPVHGRAVRQPDGGLALGWTRRARGAWAWRDGVDVPLAEEFERYRVDFVLDGVPQMTWAVDEPRLTLSAGQVSALAPGGILQVRQSGTFDLSLPLELDSVPSLSS